MGSPYFYRPRLERLEERLVLSISGPVANLTPTQTAYQNLVQASVVGEDVFYNNSAFDGNNPAANAGDDAAIATDKTALLPGQTASFANYSSYSRGINGIMVDIAGLPSNLAANDFTFMVGNNSDPTTWTPLAVAPTVTVRWGAGVGGSARVELTWPDNTIDNEWLQVTVLADAYTGLAANDVFSFGNAIGDTGNSTTDAQVNSSDVNGVVAHQGPAAITNVYDFNRDGQVNSQDTGIVQANTTTAANALNLISAPVTVAQTPFATEQPDFMHALNNDYYFFDPLIIQTNDGTLISVAEARTTPNDSSVPSIAETTSIDGGQTWSPVSMLYTVPNWPTNAVSLGSIVLDRTTGTVFLMMVENTTSVLLTSSADDGKTWSTPQDITTEVKNPSWGWIAPGPSSGIQLTVGPDAGRLMIGVDYRFTNGAGIPAYDAVVYSDDNGATWHEGGGPDPTNPANAGVNETTLAQLPNGELYMNSRLEYASNTVPARAVSVSTDGGMTWSNVQYDYSLNAPSVEGSLISLDANTLLFAAPSDPNNTTVRQQMTIWASFNNAQTWIPERVISYDFAGYSDMVALGNDTAMLVFDAGTELGGVESYEKVDLVKFNLASLLNQQPAQFTWNFNEQPIGQSPPIGGSSIRDDGPWDEPGTVESTGGVPYYVPGNTGDEALRIVNGSNVILSPATTDGLQFGTGQSFTFQFVLRTTSANGVLLGETPGQPGYTFSLSNGAVALNVNDGKNSVTLTGTTIDDGAWHTVVGVRNALTKTLSLYVDGALVATAQDTTSNLVNSSAVTLGSYADGSSQLTLDIDQVQATRAALTPAQFLPSTYVAPQALPAPTTTESGILTLPGVSFFLPPYDDRHYFADSNESNPLLIQPAQGTAAVSAIDATGQYDVVGLAAGEVHYESNATVGSYWSSQSGVGWTVLNSSGAQSPARNFDFVQNTETFTISGVFNIPTVLSNGGIELIDNNSSTSQFAGFGLSLDSTGGLDFDITDGTNDAIALTTETLGTFSNNNNSLPRLSTGGWYQVVVVGNGPGTPLQYYLTPVSATAVQQYQAAQAMTPIATPTASTRNLEIGDVSNASTPPNAPTVNFKDLAIFDQALSPAQVNQMFLDERGVTIAPPVVTASRSVSVYNPGLSAVPIDSRLALTSNDADLTGATVTISPGTLQRNDTLLFANQNGITGSYSGGVLTLSGSATPAQYEAALQSVTFANTGPTTTTATRVISIIADDGSLTSGSASEQVDVSAGAPLVTASGVNASYTIGAAGVAVDAGVTITSNDSNVTGATLTILPSTFCLGDTLNFTNQSGIAGSYVGGVLTLSGSSSVAAYQMALRSVTFSNTVNAITAHRSLTLTVSDNNATPTTSNSVSEQVHVLRPAAATGGLGLSVAAVTPSYTAGAPGIAVDAPITVTSSDTFVTGATLTISSGLQTGDRLSFSNQNGISGSYTGGVLTLTGSATSAQYQTALQSVTFSSTSTSTATRSISLVATDSHSTPATSNTVTQSVKVAAPVTITAAYINGGANWSSIDAYFGSHGEGSATYGWALQTGANQLRTLPWSTINTIVVQFSGPVGNIGLGSLELMGGTLGTPTPSSFASLGNSTYSWTFGSNFVNQSYLLAIATQGSSFGTPGSTQIVDSNGAGISGQFVTGSSSFPSGNGLAGSTFDFSFDVLPGDADRNGAVNSQDNAAEAALINDKASSAAYSPFVDVNANGTINSQDKTLSITYINNKASALTAPITPAAAQVGSTESTGSVGFTSLALGVLDTSSSSSSSLTSSTVSNVVPASTSSSSTATSNTTSTDSGSGGSSSSSFRTAMHGRHSFTATDDAVSDFDLADL